MPEAMASNTTVLRCPVKGCDFTHVEDTTPVAPEVLARMFGPGVMTAVAAQQRAWRLEGVLERHFDTHTPLDWLRTVNELRQQLEEMGQAMEEASRNYGRNLKGMTE